ncbi:hypothetical protein K505DRAFT_371004 [Melanomma pulvis-pyrius CBS 109.77]|uniref:Zn(2)-C6 fungal-type domain-containing protein n=1 Tax=Melanomma pulvis-pyrius CBS 109.77 TaxID=1314802 RepID=A0A6A6XUF1_9PLEO|nr:hypothetical protein K505DRAFT_371004 [Melanomma pulvis-pyrius CBS 109.77]
MSDVRSQARESPPAGDRPEPKRRKIRKGTQSCWECKRRKMRCTFAAPTESICDGCKRRCTRCISQEFPDELTPSMHVTGRLGQVEALVEQLVKKADLSPYQNRRETVCRLEMKTTRGKHDELSRALLAAWPSQNDLDLILSVPVAISRLLHGVICSPYSSLPFQDMPSPQDMLQLPPPGSHPVLIARKLLILGAFLQSVPPRTSQGLIGLSVSCHDIMSRVVETAVRLVTSDDELVGSVEGIECIMRESMYQNDAGNLRRAWLSMRRAMVMAQMMGLHRGVSSPSLKMLELESSINPEHMWFRLVQSDRYLSLMLGLPQGSLDNSFANSKTLDGCTPIERLERIDTVAGGCILQRNGVDLHHTDLHHYAVTREIDKMLQKAEASMPAQWWLAPNLTSNVGEIDDFRNMIHITDQFAHYHLLTQLHLPYMMRSSTDHKYDYNKITAINASRELLARFVSCFNPAASYCRGVDFIAFIASTVLCLAHINACHQPDGGNDDNVFNFLAHQRLNDRGIMERVLESMESMARTSNDVIASNIAAILRPLLAIEADVAIGGSYSTSAFSGGDDEKLECSGNITDGGNVLRIYIPYFGTIKIERGTVSKLSERQEEHEEQPLAAANCPVGYQVGGQSINPDWEAVPSHLDPLMVAPQQSTSAAKNSDHGALDAQLLVPGLAAGVDDWALQGVDMALFDNLMRGTVVRDFADEESWS